MSDAGSVPRSYGIQAWMRPYTAKETSPCQGARGGRGKGSSLPHPQQSRRRQHHAVIAEMISSAHHPHQRLPSRMPPREARLLMAAAKVGASERSLHKAVLASEVSYNTVKAF